jgi:hypothetical protein
MTNNKVFIWLAEEMLKTEFMRWIQSNGHDGISYPTLSRAQERQYQKLDLTSRQQKAERLAIEFMNEYQQQKQAA